MLGGRALLWGDFMPAAGHLRPPELFHHDPAHDIPTTDARHVCDIGPALDPTQYHDLWCYLGARDPRITRAYPDTDVFDLALGACALVDPGAGTAWIHTNGTMTIAGRPEIGDHLCALVKQWDAAARPSVSEWTIHWHHHTTGATGLLTPRWSHTAASA